MGEGCMVRHPDSQESLRSILHGASFKATPARLSLLSLLQKSKKPLSVQEIKERLGDVVDQATIYRTLKSFRDSGLVRQIDFHHQHSYYEIIEEPDHHHLVCIECDRVEDFAECNVDEIVEKVLPKSKSFDRVVGHSLELFGICKSCQNKKA
jgi:Fur family ferric uptake transcriptional regulator